MMLKILVWPINVATGDSITSWVFNITRSINRPSCMINNFLEFVIYIEGIKSIKFKTFGVCTWMYIYGMSDVRFTNEYKVGNVNTCQNLTISFWGLTSQQKVKK